VAHILLVEDDADSRDALKFLLERSGHRVSVAAGGREGIAMAASLAPDWAVIDIGLPDIDGYEAARGMRATTPSVRLVALTGYGRPEDRQRALDAGFDSYFLKPVDPHRLVEIITPPRHSPPKETPG
jgi:CheY-like chemotaxis protein